MAATMTALEALDQYAALAPDSQVAKWWTGLAEYRKKQAVESTEAVLSKPSLWGKHPAVAMTCAGIVQAVRALSARDAQIRREALVEGARWAIGRAADAVAKACDEQGESNWPAGVVAAIDPAAILEREKVTE